MIKAATILTGLCLLASPLAFAQAEAPAPTPETPAPVAPPPQAAPPPVRVVVSPTRIVTDQEAAVNESVRRQAAKVSLRQRIADAQAAEARHDTPGAAKLYSDGYDLILTVVTDVDQETQIVRAGAARTRLALASDAQRAGDLQTADRHIIELLRIDPSNETAIAFKKENDRLIAEAFPLHPNPEVAARVPAIMREHETNMTLVLSLIHI